MATVGRPPRDRACSTPVSPPKYRVGPRTPIAARPGRVTSTAGAIGLQGEHDRLEGARLGQLVAGKHGQVRAAGLRLAASQPAAYPGDARRM